MSTSEIDFELKVQPKAGWVDAIFIGNILGEFLASLRKETDGAFEYALVQNGKGKAPSGRESVGKRTSFMCAGIIWGRTFGSGV